MSNIPIRADEAGGVQNRELSEALENAANIINKNYLSGLDELEIASPAGEDLDIDIVRCGKFYKLKKLVRNKKENFLDKLITIANVVCSVEGTLATVIHSDGVETDYYIGIISKNYRAGNARNKAVRAASAAAFSGAVRGNFTGSDLRLLDEEETKEMRRRIFDEKAEAVSAISGIVALRSRDTREITGYVQGIENLTNSLRGKKYSILMIADSISTDRLQCMKQGYEMIYTQLSAFLKTVVTVNESDQITISGSQTIGITKGITEGISRTQSSGSVHSRNFGMNAGVHIAPMGVGAAFGISAGTSNGTTKGESFGTSSTSSEQTTRQNSSSAARSSGTGKSLQTSLENRSIRELLERIDLHIKRLSLCESFGAFDCAAYIISESNEDTLAVSSNYNALMRGEESFAQASHISIWNENSIKQIKGNDSWKMVRQKDELLNYLRSFVHPRFYLNSGKKITVTPASQISGKELAIQFGLPKKSINGLTVVEMAPFGRNPSWEEGEQLGIGHLYYMGEKENTRVNLNLNSLASHMFITGSTGTGKSNAVCQILAGLLAKQIPFLVIEPAKGEYKYIFGGRSDVNVFGTNSKKTRLLRINPFQFPDDIHVLEHIDRLIEIFNVCWPMYAAMPAVLKEAVERAYRIAGWDLDESINRYPIPLYPSFQDVLEELYTVVNESDFSAELKGNYIGALVTRVKSLTNGIVGQIFVSEEIGSSTLFDSNTIVDLSRIASIETKAMIMGILVMKLQEHRMTGGGINQPLRHVTVLEEAHNLLKGTSSEQLTEGSNILGKSVEMLSQSIAEMRTYGEGFLIVDQAPGLLDRSVIRNTNTKMILRLPDMSDRELCGRAADLNSDQITELAKLPTGVAALYQNNWIEPILCKFRKYEADEKEFAFVPEKSIHKERRLKETLIRCLLCDCVGERVEYSIDDLKERVSFSELPVKAKRKVLECLENPDKDMDRVKAAVSSLFRTEDLLKAASVEPCIEKWNGSLWRQLDFDFTNLDSAYQNVVLQCILKEKCENDSELEPVYNKWTTYMRGEGLG